MKPVTNEKLPFRNGCITWFTKESPDEIWSDKLRYFAYGVETCPTTGRRHLQGFACMHAPQRLKAWKKVFPGAHIEIMRGTLQQSETYCSKESELIQLGEKPLRNGQRKDLAVFCDEVKKGTKMKDLAAEMPITYVQYHAGLERLQAMFAPSYEHDKVRGVWIYGPPGTGKTTYAAQKYAPYYKKPQNKWWCGYNGEPNIIFDDYDAKDAFGHEFKIWMDKGACSGETKGGKVQLHHHHFVVTSNYSIEECFGNNPLMCEAIRRRCKIIYAAPGKYLSDADVDE